MVTAAGLELWPGGRPDCLDRAGGDLVLPDGSPGRLRRGRYRKPWLAGRTWTSPERVQMSLLFRLQRYGVAASDVLAVGERPTADGHIDTFLLTRLRGWVVGLGEFLAACESPAERQALCWKRRKPSSPGCIGRGVTSAAKWKSWRSSSWRTFRHTSRLTGASGLVLRRRLRAWWRWRNLRRLRPARRLGALPCLTEGCP